MPNRITAGIKEMVLGALEDVGGREYLADCAINQPVAFLGLLGKILPHQLTGENGAPVSIDFRWADAATATPPQLEAEVADFIATADDDDC